MHDLEVHDIYITHDIVQSLGQKLIVTDEHPVKVGGTGTEVDGVTRADDDTAMDEDEVDSVDDSSSLILFAVKFCMSWLQIFCPFVVVLRIFETFFSCSSLTCLYVRTPSILRWPVLDIMSCSSTPLLNSLVAAVTRRE